jgi:hypothetical protein
MQVTSLKNALVSFGNRKLPASTMIFNMGPASSCPSRKRGLCLVADACYAIKAEKFRKQVLPYRTRQAELWQNHDAAELIEYFTSIIDRKRNKPTLFRINEAGDFYGQSDVQKLDKIARILRKKYGIITYGYSARADLDFSGVAFRIKGSGHDVGNNGKTVVIDREAKAPAGFIKCPASCKTCTLCAKRGNIAFAKH